MEENKRFFDLTKENYNYIVSLLSNDLKDRMKKYIDLYKKENIIILCIGTDKIKMDSYGPIIGSELAQKCLPLNVKVFGYIGETLNACNLLSFTYENAKELENSLVIVIDCMVSFNSSVGTIVTSNSGIFPGKGIGKNLPYIGDISICGVLSNSTNLFDHLNLNLDNELFEKMCSVTFEALYISLMSLEGKFDEEIDLDDYPILEELKIISKNVRKNNILNIFDDLNISKTDYQDEYSKKLVNTNKQQNQ